jgi:inosine/xanthosine triphosphate pyrophosphatase family protein
MAELSPEDKNKISHRGRALAAARDVLRTLCDGKANECDSNS